MYIDYGSFVFLQLVNTRLKFYNQIVTVNDRHSGTHLKN